MRKLLVSLGAILSGWLIVYSSVGAADDHTNTEGLLHRPIATDAGSRQKSLKVLTRAELERIKKEINTAETALEQFKLALKDASFPSNGFNYNHRNIVVPFQFGVALWGMHGLFNSGSLWEAGQRRWAVVGAVGGATLAAMGGLGTTLMILSSVEIGRYIRQIPEIEHWIQERKDYVRRTERILNEGND
jgi:hypothetical protein